MIPEMIPETLPETLPQTRRLTSCLRPPLASIRCHLLSLECHFRCHLQAEDDLKRLEVWPQHAFNMERWRQLR